MHTPVYLSVIVPVYNTAKYLSKCLESLRLQTLDKIEIILVDDGSSDGSHEILAEYEKRDSRFRLVSQENRGFAGARNRGLEEAAGEFIGFVDSDDWIEPDMYEKLWNEHISSPEADIVQCGYIHEYPEENISLPSDNIVYRDRLIRSGGKLCGAESLLLDDGTIWNRIYRRQMLCENGIAFDPVMTFGEDVFFYWTALISAKQIAAIPQRLYHYRRNRLGSQVFCKDRRIFAYFKTMEGIDKFIRERGYLELVPWINHLKLSYLTWGMERLEPSMHREYFEEFQAFLKRSGVNRKALIAYPPLDGGLMYNGRYLLLRFLHPLTLDAILSGKWGRFCRIVSFRRFLATLPLSLARICKKKKRVAI